MLKDWWIVRWWGALRLHIEWLFRINVQYWSPQIPVQAYWTYYSSTMPEISFNLENIHKILTNIDVSNSSGPDEVPGVLFKVCADVFTPILLVVFTLSHKKSEITQAIKLAIIVPLYKSGGKIAPGKYCPISLAPNIAKICESLVYNSLVNHVESNNIMSSSQHGFFKNK